MKTNYLLIDYENVQPKGIELLKGTAFKVIVFLGENQTKIPVTFANEMQHLGENAQYGQGEKIIYHLTAAP